MLSNRIRYTDDEVLKEIIKTVNNKFRDILEAEISQTPDDVSERTRIIDDCKHTFEKKFERALKLNVDYDEATNTQSFVAKDEERIRNERLNYYNDVVYPQMTNMILEVADKRKKYPKAICEVLKSTFSSQRQLYELKKSAVLKTENQFLQPEECLELPVHKLRQLESFNLVADNLKEKAQNIICARSCVDNLKTLMDDTS